MATRGTSALTPPVAQALVAAARAGATIPTAAVAVDVSARTVRRWLTRGETERMRLETSYPDDDVDPTDPRVLDDARPYYALSKAWQGATAGSQGEVTAVVYRAATEGLTDVTVIRDAHGHVRRRIERTRIDVRALLWLAERLDPDRFHLPARLEVSGPSGGAVPVPIAGMTENQAEAIVILLREVVDGLVELAPPRTAERMRRAVPEVVQGAFDALIDGEMPSSN